MMGLATDGGLLLPETYPRVDDATLARWQMAGGFLIRRSPARSWGTLLTTSRPGICRRTTWGRC